MGAGAARRQTGVRYEDVAGIDHVKADIEAMMDAVLGRGGYSEMGVKPPRVRGANSWFILSCASRVNRTSLGDPHAGKCRCQSASRHLPVLAGYQGLITP